MNYVQTAKWKSLINLKLFDTHEKNTISITLDRERREEQCKIMFLSHMLSFNIHHNKPLPHTIGYCSPKKSTNKLGFILVKLLLQNIEKSFQQKLRIGGTSLVWLSSENFNRTYKGVVSPWLYYIPLHCVTFGQNQ